MQEIGIYEAKTKLGQLVSCVEAGEQIAITRRGKVVARLMPPEGMYDRQAAIDAAQHIREMSKGVTLGGITIKELINEGRKW